jgi:hypothetical protein
VPKVNLWELITTVAGKDLPNSGMCQAIKNKLGPRFGSELSLEITEQGAWIIEVFDHEDSGERVILSIQPDGYLDVTRYRKSNGIFEQRRVAF